MVFVDSRNLGWRPFLWRWLNGRTAPGEADALQPLFEKYAAPGIDWVVEGLDGGDIVKRPAQSVPLTGLNLLAQLCGLLDATLGGAGAGEGAEGGGKVLDPQVGAGWEGCIDRRPRCRGGSITLLIDDTGSKQTLGIERIVAKHGKGLRGPS
jgi:hypothetical protein